MRFKPALAYSILFFLSGATGLVYELLWVRVLYQSFGSTIQSVTTVVAAHIGGPGAWRASKLRTREAGALGRGLRGRGRPGRRGGRSAEDVADFPRGGDHVIDVA